MTSLTKRHRKMNSDNDSLVCYEEGMPASTGPVPYEREFDYGKNGVTYILNAPSLFDDNYVRSEGDAIYIFRVYKL